MIYSSSDGGQSWQVDTLLDRKMEHVSFDSRGRAYVCGQDQLLIREPGQAQWQVLRTDFQWLRCAHFPTEKYGATVGGEGFHGGRLHVFGPNAFWQQDTLHDIDGELDAVWYADSTTLLAAGAGWVIRSTDAGKSWERLRIENDIFTAIHFPTSQTGYLCGNQGSLYKTMNGGASWTKLRQGGSTGARHKPFRALWFKDADTGWLVGDNGIFWQTNDGGDTWKSIENAPSDADFTDIFWIGNQGWATARGGRLFRMMNDE